LYKDISRVYRIMRIFFLIFFSPPFCNSSEAECFDHYGFSNNQLTCSVTFLEKPVVTQLIKSPPSVEECFFIFQVTTVRLADISKIQVLLFCQCCINPLCKLFVTCTNNIYCGVLLTFKYVKLFK